MSANLTDDPLTYTTPIVVPSDGDALNAASVVSGFQGLANRTAYLLAASGVTNAAVLGVGASKQIALPIIAMGINASARFTDMGAGILQQTDVTDAGGVSAVVCMPAINGQITSVSMYRIGGGSHAGTAPGTVPSLLLRKYDPATNTLSTIATVTDTTSGANWDTAQVVIQGTITNGTITPTQVYYLTLTGENGANKQLNWQLRGARCTIAP